MASDAFVVGEDWISEHYFTTDATSQSFHARTLARRKEWDELASSADGARAVATPRSRFTAARNELSAALSSTNPSDPQAIRDALLIPLRRVLGFTSGAGRELDAAGPLTLVRQAGIEGAPAVAVLDATPVESLEDLLVKDDNTLLEPFTLADDPNHPIRSVARLLSRIFVADDAPPYAVVLAGRWALVAERERWAEGRYLAVDVQLVADRNETGRAKEIDRMLAALSADSFVPDAEGVVWWSSVLEESVKHTVGVSKDLRDGVRLSIEIIGNDVVHRRATRGLAPLPPEEAQPLAKQALRYLYRILFLLYAEASPELQVLPVNVAEYEEGYSLDRLRELVLVEQLSHDSACGTHLYQSLDVLFRMVDQGSPEPRDPDAEREGLVFNSLRADLFAPRAIAHVSAVGLSDGALQRVLAHLLLTKRQGKRDRGFISYADLGINQLGAVYEGLMSYTGFFAETELLELAKDGDASKGSWVVPVERADDPVFKSHFVHLEDPLTGERRPVRHERGSFVFRLAGRERQQSASYYSPEVLTRFVVSQALVELLDQDGHTTSAAEILKLTVCEPALGSGAFAIEAVRQLAEQYLQRRQEELGEAIDPDAYPRELQKVKASIALHQVYGVDLNATAVELAEISLWLDTMVAGLDAPWFGLHLKRGNSLIGARRAVFSRAQVESKGWLTDVPRDVPITSLADDLREGRLGSEISGSIHHFLLPSAGWGSAAEAKEAKELAPEAVATLKAWRRSVTAKPTKKEIDRLSALSYRVEALWQLALRRLEVAENEVRRDIDLWGADEQPPPGSLQRPEIESKLGDSGGAFQRLRRVMDAWSALWFWPLTQSDVAPPTTDQWIEGLEAVLGMHREERRSRGARYGSADLTPGTSWADLGTAEDWDLSIAGVVDIDRALREHPWLAVAEGIARTQGFFHWELDFATVFQRGGFDLQVGNPPWVRPRSDIDALLAEGDPWWQLAVKPTQAVVSTRRAATLELNGMSELVLGGTSDVAVLAAFVGAPQNYPYLTGLQPDLYRCFMSQAWRHSSLRGIASLIHPETHFTDEKAGLLRAGTYERLRRHWQFVNELSLFEVHHLVSYGVHVYGAGREVGFDMATSLYHPDTVGRSYLHDGSGEEPGLKDRDGKWDLRPHRNRIITVDKETLGTWHAILESSDTPIRRTRMVYAVNRATAAVLDKLSAAPRLGELGLEFSAGWHEKNDRTKGYFDVEWGPVDSWRDAILQGPHLFVSNPFYKSPNETLLHNQDWSAVDLETLGPDALPVTAYKPSGYRSTYDLAFTHWGPERMPARDHYRVSWRYMAANTGQRTLISAVIPPGTAPTHGLNSLGHRSQLRHTMLVGAITSALLSDFQVRTAPKANIPRSTIERLAWSPAHQLTSDLLVRYGRLVCLSNAWADAWDAVMTHIEEPYRVEWSSVVPLRKDIERRQAQVEIDAIVALMLGVTADELCTVYRTQFAVLYGYDRNVYFYDANGRLVPNSVLTGWRKRGEGITEEERTATNASGNTYTYELPFVTLDREADMRQAYAHFERVLEERS